MKRFATLPSLACALAGTLTLAACSDDASPTGAMAPGARSSTELAGEESQLVVFTNKSIPAEFAAQVEAMGGRIEHSLDAVGVAVVSGIDAEEAGTLKAGGAIQFMEPETVFQIAEPAVTADLSEEDQLLASTEPQSTTEPGKATYHYLQWHLRHIGAPQAWAAGKLGSPAVTVGIIDTGLDYLQRDLAGLVDIARSRSFLPSEDAVVARYLPAGTHPMFDLQGHGTHVGSTVSSNGIGAAGVTSRTRLVGLKVCRSGIPGLTASGCPAGATFAAIMYAADNGIDVVNMSLGGWFTRRGNGGYEATVNRVFEYAKAKKLTVVVAAGNDNIDLAHGLVPVTKDGVTTIHSYPSLYATYCSSSSTICVSATGPTSSRHSQAGPWYDMDAKAGYSNYGRDAIDVAAPGGTGAGLVWAGCPTMRVVQTSATTWSGRTDSYCRTFPRGMGGTSMAAPHVAGLAALMVQKHGKNPSAVSEAIAKFSDDLGEPGMDPIYGKGRINVARSLGL